MRTKGFHSLDEMQKPFLPQKNVSSNAIYEPLAYENSISQIFFVILLKRDYPR